MLNKATSSNHSKAMQKISLELFAEHFKKLNTAGNSEQDNYPNIDLENISDFNVFLNCEITEEEVSKCIHKLKLNKACSSDLILNEFLRHSKTYMLTAFTKLFNIVFMTGIVPEEWSQGIISPIYKNKGDRTDPDNYRGITILSCFGKLFTAVLNARLNKYLEDSNLLCEEQAGFRKNYSTTDHIFNLKCLIDLYLFRGKKLYCAFIDYKKAFDSVNRIYLWQKLLSLNVDGKMFKIIHNMYEQAKSCVKAGNCKSQFFSCNVGVRQGENLSPILFSIFLNDLTEFISHAYEGLNRISNMAHLLLSDDDVEVYFKLYILLYADDTVIFAENEHELQAALNAMFLYCKSWDLEVNPTKTKITIFSNKKLNNVPSFKYNGHNLEVDDSFVYLGTLFSCNGRFLKNSKRLYDQARKAMYSVLRKSKVLCLPADIQLQLFDSMVAPILLYGSEVSGFEKSDLLESLYLQFYKIILKAKKSTPNVILYGELGRYPIDLIVKSRMIGFWQRIVNSKSDKISNKLYSILLSMHKRGLFHSKWLMTVKNTLYDNGFEHIWDSHSNIPLNISKKIKLKLIEKYKESWKEIIYVTPKCLNYRIFKHELQIEKYFSILPSDLAIAFCHFRTLNHRLPIEQGRFWGVARDDRICELCFLDKLGDEYHYILECTYFDCQRKQYLSRDLLSKHNTYKFEKLMNTCDIHTLFKLSKFCKDILNTFKEIHKVIG